MDPVVINDVQVCLYLNSQYSLVLSLCSSKHTFCEARSMVFISLWIFVIMVYTFLDVQSNIACRIDFSKISLVRSKKVGFCKICKDGVEDIEHFILKCKPLSEVRQNKLEQFKRTVEDIKGGWCRTT
jgi:hypothetical protein